MELRKNTMFYLLFINHDGAGQILHSEEFQAVELCKTDNNSFLSITADDIDNASDLLLEVSLLIGDDQMEEAKAAKIGGLEDLAGAWDPVALQRSQELSMELKF